MSYFRRLVSLLCVCIVSLSFFASAARAQPQPVLLTVIVADPTHIVFTTTGAFPQINDNTHTPLGGILLADLFTADFEMSSTTAPLPGNFATTGSVAFEVAFSDGTPPQRHFNLFTPPFTPGAKDPSTYSMTTPAFVGSNVANLSGFPPVALQSPGFIGNVQAGDIAPVSPVIGSYLVIVPEPTGIATLGVSVFCRRRRPVHNNA